MQASLQSGAKGIVYGTVSKDATWIETVQISQNNLPIDGATTSTWTFTFRRCGSIEWTLTSSDGMTITQGDIGTLIAISKDVPSNLCGVYHADLKETRADDTVVHWLHGTVTFND